MNDSEAMRAIAELLDGKEWNSDTLGQIAEIVIGAGYLIRDSNMEDLDDYLKNH